MAKKDIYNGIKIIIIINTITALEKEFIVGVFFLKLILQLFPRIVVSGSR